MQINKDRNHSTVNPKHKGVLLKNGSLVSLNALRLTTIKHQKNKTNKNLKDKFIKKMVKSLTRSTPMLAKWQAKDHSLPDRRPPFL